MVHTYLKTTEYSGYLLAEWSDPSSAVTPVSHWDVIARDSRIIATEDTEQAARDIARQFREYGRG